MCKDVILEIIEDYISTIPIPRSNWKRERNRQVSYARTAAKELYLYVKKQDDPVPISSIEHFVNLMDDLSCVNANTSYMFSVAKDTTEDILDTILANI